MTVKFVRAMALAGLIACSPGCMSFEIAGSGDRDKTPDRQRGQDTIHGSYWGFRWDEKDVVKCKPGYELFAIEYHDNALYSLTSILTLGLYVPQDVEYWCVPREDSGGNEGPSLKKKPGKD